MGIIRVEMAKTGNNIFETPTGLVLQREFESAAPNGAPMSGRWVLRGATGQLIDFDPSLNNIVKRNNICLKLGGHAQT